MPTYVVTDWIYGPMGPGFFIKFPRHTDVWYDGGTMHEKITKDEGGREIEDKRGELFALVMLMREQR